MPVQAGGGWEGLLQARGAPVFWPEIQISWPVEGLAPSLGCAYGGFHVVIPEIRVTATAGGTRAT